MPSGGKGRLRQDGQLARQFAAVVLAHILTTQRNLARQGHNQPGTGAQQRGFATAVRTKDGRHLALRQIRRQILQHHAARLAQGKALDLQESFAHNSPLSISRVRRHSR
jgi:hypothetical protein